MSDFLACRPDCHDGFQHDILHRRATIDAEAEKAKGDVNG